MIFQVKLISEKMVVILTKQTITHVYKYAFKVRPKMILLKVSRYISIYFHIARGVPGTPVPQSTVQAQISQATPCMDSGNIYITCISHH